MAVLGSADVLHPEGLTSAQSPSVHPTCTKHRPTAGSRGLERSLKDSSETTWSTAFPQLADRNSLVIMSGQGQGRTADLPLFSRSGCPVQTRTCESSRLFTVAFGRWRLPSLPSRLPSKTPHGIYAHRTVRGCASLGYEQADCLGPVHLGGDGQDARVAHPRQTRPGLSRPAGELGREPQSQPARDSPRCRQYSLAGELVHRPWQRTGANRGPCWASLGW